MLSSEQYDLKSENVVFVHGIGKRKTPLQKSIESLEEYLSKLTEYNQKIHICGERNSYSKTDFDATFMRMKEDSMLSYLPQTHSLKYNFFHLFSSDTIKSQIHTGYLQQL